MDNMNLNKHISGQFNAELESVRNQVLVMGGLVEQQLTDAIAAIHDQDLDAALAVYKEDDKVDREYESIIRELMTYMMEDPRTIPQVLNVLWAARAIERVGDRCQHICEYIVYYVKGKDVRHTKADDLSDLLGKG